MHHHPSETIGTTVVQMIRHCVLLRFGAEVSNIDKDAIYERLASLQSVVPGFERIVCGPTSSAERLSQGFDDGFVIEFVDASARNAYLADPDHRRGTSSVGRHARRWTHGTRRVRPRRQCTPSTGRRRYGPMSATRPFG